MSKTQINAWLPAPEGREVEVAEQMSQILQDEDVEFGISTVGPDEEAGMELVFISEDLKEVPIMLIKISLNKITGERNKVQSFLSKLAYQFRVEPLKSMISYPNKQYFIPTHEGKELIQIDFLNAGKHTEAEVDEINSLISKTAQDILEKPGKYFADYFNEISAKDPDLKMQSRMVEDKLQYQMLCNETPITGWVYMEEGVSWDDYVKQLYAIYQEKLKNS